MPKLKIETNGTSQKQNLNNLVDIIFKMVRDPNWEAESLNHHTDVCDKPMCILGQYLAECIPSLVEENVAYRRVLFLAFSQRDTFHLTTEFGLEGDGLLKLKSIFEDSNVKNPTLVHRLQIACELAGLTK